MGKLYDDYFGKQRTVTENARVTKKPLTVTEIHKTMDMVIADMKRERRGRPKKANALTAAAKQRAYRERKKTNG